MGQNYRIYLNQKVILITDAKPGRQTSYEQISDIDFDLKLLYAALLNSKSDNFYIKCPNPKAYLKRITKSLPLIKAAGGLVKNAHGAYLFIFRNGKWDIPKGKVEKYEKIKQAAVREVEEECGIKVSSLKKKICKTYHAYTYKGEVVLKKTWWFNMDCQACDKLVPQTEEGITDAQWLHHDKIALVTENTFPSIMDVLVEQKLVKAKQALPQG